MLCEANTIDSNITGLRYAEEECLGILPASTDAKAATGLLTFSANPTADDTFTIGTRTYTFKDALTSAADEILIGGAVGDTVENTVAALNGNLGAGGQYGAGTAANEDVAATQGPGNAVTVIARAAGTDGNAIASTATGSAVSWGGATLAGGAAADDGDVTWKPLEPNSYQDFGGQTTLVARNPINPSRQQKKGVITDMDASGQFNQDLTQTNAQDLLQGFVFADTRTKGTDTAADYLKTAAAGDIAVVTTGNLSKLTSTALDFTTLGLVPGEWVFLGGDASATRFAEDDNNGFKRIRKIEAHALTIDKSNFPMVDDAGTGKTISIYMGRVLKNESDTSKIKKRSYQIERTLGSLDGLQPPQAEYLVGAVPSQFVLHMTTAAIVNADFSFTATDNEQRRQIDGLKAGARPALVESDAFDAANSLKRINISLAGGLTEAPQPLFGYATEFTLTLDNNLSANKGLGKLGAIGVSAGTFAVSGSLTAYFSDIAAVQAVRNNADVTMDMIFVKDGAGIVIDMPLIALGGGRADVTLNQPINLPLTSEAASGAKIDPDMDHTLLFVFFDKLPDIAAQA